MFQLESDDNKTSEIEDLRNRVDSLEKKLSCLLKKRFRSYFTEKQKRDLISILNKKGTKAAQKAASKLLGREVDRTLVPQYKRRMRLKRIVDV